MKHIFGRIIGYTLLYCGILLGIFILQFTKGQTFSVSLGSMTVTGREERTENGTIVPLLPLHIISHGLDIYISEQNPVYAADADDRMIPLQVLAYQRQEENDLFTVTCSEDIVLSFFADEQGEIETLRIEASFPPYISKVLLPWRITQNAGIERTDNRIFVRSGKKQYSFIGSFGFNTEETTAQSDIPHLVLSKVQPTAYYKTYLPLQELDINTIPSMAQASTDAYMAALNTFATAVINTESQALAAKKITESGLTAYIAEMGQRGNFAEGIEKVPAQTLARTQRTYLSNPFYGNIQGTHTGLAAADAKKRDLYAALIIAQNNELFEQEGLIPFLADRGSQRLVDGLFQFIEKLDGKTLNARQAAGLLSIWLDCTHYYPNKKPLFEELLPLCEEKITESLLLIDEGLYISNDETYIDTVVGFASAQILLRYGSVQSAVWESVGRMLITSLLRYAGDAAGLPVGFNVTGSKTTQLGLIADDSSVLDAGALYPVVMPHNSWYPHAQSLALQAEPGIWAWTCAQDIEVLENTAKTLSLRVRFPEGQSHYLTLHGIRPFYRIELYGIPFRSDARFEMYNSSGYAYNANSKILYLKMRHKSEYETIRLSFGTSPQQKNVQQAQPAASTADAVPASSPASEPVSPQTETPASAEAGAVSPVQGSFGANPSDTLPQTGESDEYR